RNKDALATARNRADVLLGLNTWVLDPAARSRRYNSAVLICRGGLPGGRYDKIHLVPFGEYLPFREVPGMQHFSPYEGDYSVTPGERQTRFPLGEYRYGVLICYEDSYAALARGYVAPGDEPRADFLLNTSNDGWFDGTSEHEEH